LEKESVAYGLPVLFLTKKGILKITKFGEKGYFLTDLSNKGRINQK
jgi:hypothetical protein